MISKKDVPHYPCIPCSRTLYRLWRVQPRMSAGYSAASVNRKFIKDIDTFYGEYQAGEDTDSKAPLTNFTFDDVEPSIVGERG